MGTQYIENPETKERIPFEWNNPNPPTSDDIEGLFQAVKMNVPQPSSQPQETGLVDQLAKRGKDFIGAYGSLADMGKGDWFSPMPIIRPSLRAMGAVTGAVGDIAGKAIEGGVKMAIPDKIQEYWKMGIPDVLDNPIGKFGIAALKAGGEAWDKFQIKYPEIAQDTKDYANTLGIMPIGKGAQKGTEAILSKIPTQTYVPQLADKLITNYVDKGMRKGIAYGVSGKQDIARLNEYTNKAAEGVKSIIRDKQGITLIDEAGGTVTGELPKTVKQMSDAIYQRKKTIWNDVEAKHQTATGEGLVLDTAPLNDMLQTEAGTTRNTLTGADKLALERASRYEMPSSIPDEPPAIRRLTPSEAQQQIQDINAELITHWNNKAKGMTPEQDILIKERNILSKMLDDALDDPAYQELKNEWGSLKQIEKDVAHRATVTGRQHFRGLIDMSDVWSTPELALGILTMNPSQVGMALGVKAVKRYTKWVNSNDRIVSKMFTDVEKVMDRTRVPIPKPLKTEIVDKDIPRNWLNQEAPVKPYPVEWKPELTNIPESKGLWQQMRDTETLQNNLKLKQGSIGQEPQAPLPTSSIQQSIGLPGTTPRGTSLLIGGAGTTPKELLSSPEKIVVRGQSWDKMAGQPTGEPITFANTYKNMKSPEEKKQFLQDVAAKIKETGKDKDTATIELLNERRTK